MAKRKNINFPVIIKHEKFTRIGESIVVQIKGGLWRYKSENEKIDFSSRLGAVSYAVAYETNNSPDNIEVPIIPLPAPYVRPKAESDSPGPVPDGNVNDG